MTSKSSKQPRLKAVTPPKDKEAKSIETLTEELVGKITKRDFEEMVKEVQKQDSVIDRARKNKQAAYAKLSNKGASTKGLQYIVAKQEKPKADQALVDATLRAYAEVTGQSDFFGPADGIGAAQDDDDED